jgi:hypothetical protein
MPETEESRKATRRRNAIEIALVVLAILAVAGSFIYMWLTETLDHLH